MRLEEGLQHLAVVLWAPAFGEIDWGAFAINRPAHLWLPIGRKKRRLDSPIGGRYFSRYFSGPFGVGDPYALHCLLLYIFGG